MANFQEVFEGRNLLVMMGETKCVCVYTCDKGGHVACMEEIRNEHTIRKPKGKRKFYKYKRIQLIALNQRDVRVAKRTMSSDERV